MQNANPKPKRTLHVGTIPAVPLLIALIWLLCWPLLSYGVISKGVCTGIILATVLWFLVWLARASGRD